MPTVKQTIEQLEDELGLPIVLMSATDHATGAQMIFRLRDLPLTGIVAVVQWLNDRLSTP